MNVGSTAATKAKIRFDGETMKKIAPVGVTILALSTAALGAEADLDKVLAFFVHALPVTRLRPTAT
jgi:hypothetical protein